MQTPRLRDVSLSKHRIEAFTDGVFAIVVTLLVLEIHPPELARKASDPEILEGLREVVFPLVSFGITFILASAFWLLHHLTYRFIEKTNRVLLWINILFLLFVSLLPFSTAMLGRFSLEAGIPRVVYFSNFFAVGLMLLLHLAYARRRNLVLDDPADEAAMKELQGRIATLVVASLAGTIASLITPAYAFWAFIIVILLGRALTRRLAPRSSS